MLVVQHPIVTCGMGGERLRVCVCEPVLKCGLGNRWMEDRVSCEPVVVEVSWRGGVRDRCRMGGGARTPLRGFGRLGGFGVGVLALAGGGAAGAACDGAVEGV